MSEILGDKLNIVYEDTLLEITPELMKKTILKQDKEIERLHTIIKEVREEVRIYEIQSNDGVTNELDNYVFVQRLKNVLDKVGDEK